MYLVMINIPLNIQNYIISKLLLQGLKTYLGRTEDLVIDLMNKESVDQENIAYLFMKLDNLSNSWLQFLVRLKWSRKKIKYKLIILSNQKSRNFIQALLLLDTALLIKESLNDIDIYKRLSQFLIQFQNVNEQRKSQRIIPRKEDKAIINLPIPNSNLILSGKIINLTMFGLAIDFNLNKGQLHGVYEGQLIENAQLFINKKKGITALKIMIIKNNIVGAKLIRSSNYVINILGRYLIDRFSDNAF